MAESESGADKTEDPTEKRKKDSREKGEIARSKELNTLAIMLAGSIGLLIFVIVLTCFSFSDLFPKFIKENYIMKYSLKALPCCIVWFRIIYELMTMDFEKDYQLT